MNITQKHIDATVNELARLRAIYGGLVTRQWVLQNAKLLIDLEAAGLTHFGGPEVLAAWLVERAQPKRHMTKAKRKQLIAMCGRSQKALGLLVKLANPVQPYRWQLGWSFLRLNSYLAILCAERVAEREAQLDHKPRSC